MPAVYRGTPRYSVVGMSDASRTGVADPDAGSLAVATYPPPSVWTAGAIAADALPVLDLPPVAGAPLGVYVHLPFCRQHCHFCCVPVVTGRSATDVDAYLRLIAGEWAQYGSRRAIEGRSPAYVYIGGGTPSLLVPAQLEGLAARLRGTLSWDHVEDVTVECEPGTFTAETARRLRAIGVTRLCLGAASFSRPALSRSGRGHRPSDIARACRSARTAGLPHVEIELVAGLPGETDASWPLGVEQAVALDADSVTIYQLEQIPATPIGTGTAPGAADLRAALPPGATRRRWTRDAFDALEAAGYVMIDAYTATRAPGRARPAHRDIAARGGDLVGLGVSSRGYVNGVLLQNVEDLDAYARAVSRGDLPLGRAHHASPDERLIREFALQLKQGSVRPAYFLEKFDVDLLKRFASPFAMLRADGYLDDATPDDVRLTRDGLLRVDALLPRFFLPEHAFARSA